MTPSAFSGAKAALLCDGHILTYQRDDRPDIPWPGLWDLPGGGAEPGETPLNCLLREVLEEFGLHLSPACLVWRGSFPATLAPERLGWFFLGAISADQVAAIRFGPEGQRWAMMPLDLWLSRPDAVRPMQDRTALALSETSRMTASPTLAAALAAIDAANAADPTAEDGQPAALIYGQRMTAELNRLFPDASDILRIAARGQHVERWTLARSVYPQGKAGYLEWRREQGRRHGVRVAQIMAEAGYAPHDCDRVQVLLRKEGIKRDPEVQALEDVICFVFLRWYFQPFAAGRDPAELLDIVVKTARKMSAEGRARVLAEFPLPDDFAAAFKG